MRSPFALRRAVPSVAFRTLALAAALVAALLALMGGSGRPAVGPMERSSFRGGAGYWLLAKDGGVFAFGDARFFGPNRNQGRDIAGMAATATGNGYWTADDDGDVFAYGDAVDYGSRPGPEIDNITGFAARAQGDGYWMVASDGSVYAFGGAAYFGSANTLPLARPIVGMAATPSGKGYWLIAGDGGVFAYGDAGFFGSTGNIRLARPIVDFAPSPDGKGYRFIGSDGGVFAYGSAGFFGSTGAIRLNKPVVGFAGTASGKGYWLVAEDGGVFAFGDAAFYGSTGALTLNAPIVAIVATPKVKVNPTARADSATVAEDASVTIDVQANDTRVLPATVSVESAPAQGTAAVSGGKIVYTPKADYNGSDTFKYRLTDSDGHSDTATVTVTVTAVNDAPTISNVANQTTNEDTPTGAVAFSIADIDSGTLTVSAGSSNTSLVPNGNLALGGSGGSRTVTATPAPNQNGTSTITLTVSDGSLSSSDTFVLTVTAVNDAPTISDVSDQTTDVSTATGAIAVTIGDAETPTATLGFTANSSNLPLVPDANIVLGGSDANRTLTITPVAGQSGTAIITLTVSDGSLTATDTFQLTVNTLPAISDVADQVTDEDVAVGPLSITVGDAQTAAGSLTLSADSSNATLVPNGNVVFDGSGANRTVTITPAPNQSGSSTITLSVTDDLGGTATDSFTLTVTPVNDAPTVSDITDQSTDEDTTTSAIPFTVGDVETPTGSLSVSGTSSNTALVPDDNITIGGSGANRTLTITPAENENGTATITVTVDDGTLTATETFVLTVNAVNDPPTISVIGDVSIDENGVSLPLAFTIGDPDTALGSLVVTGESGNDSLVPDANVVIAGAGSSWTVTVTPTADASGQATITVTVEDGSGGITTEEFTVTVAVNDQPVAQDDVVSLINALLPIDVLDNDSGLSDGLLSIEIIGSEGGAEVNLDDTISITSLLDLDSDGSITFQYKVTDNDGDFAVGTVTVDLGL